MTSALDLLIAMWNSGPRGRVMLCLCAIIVSLWVFPGPVAASDGGGTDEPDCPGTGTENNLGSVFYVSTSGMRPRLEVLMDNPLSATFNYTLICDAKCTNFTISLTAPDPDLLIITSNTTFTVSCNDAVLANRIFVPASLPAVAPSGPPTYMLQGKLPVNVDGGIIGRTVIEFVVTKYSRNLTYAVNNGNGTAFPEVINVDDVEHDVMVDVVSEKAFPVAVIRKMRPVDVIFRLVVYCVQIFVMTGFGAKLDLKIVKENLWRPIAPGIGLTCQYILMPLIAFAVAKSVPIENDAVALGIFVAGVCPGGGASNMYSYLLKGDLSLSITMTALSTIVALAMMPLWVYTLGRLFNLGTGVTIPFHMVAVSLSVLVIPLVFGVFLRQKFPKIADKVQKMLKPVVVIMSFVLLVVGIYSNLYIFRLFKPRIILAGLLLPYVGYFIGGAVAAIFRQGWKRVKTISIETGMQNTSIGYILLINSFPSPDGDIAAVGPVASAVMTPLPPFTVTVIYLIYRFCKKRYTPVPQHEQDGAEEKETETNGDVELDEKKEKNGDVELDEKKEKNGDVEFDDLPKEKLPLV